MTSRQGSDDISKEFQSVSMDKLELGEANIRRRDITADIDELAYSIGTFGLQHPIVIQPIGDKYEIVIGQRRYLAAKQLGWTKIPARIMSERLSEFDARVLSFSENVQRRDLSPRDKANTCSYLLNRLGTPSAVAEHLGVTEQTVRKWLEYADVPETLKHLVEEKIITRPQATRLFQYVPNVEKAERIAKRMQEMRAPKKHRDRIFASIEEAPRSTIEDIFKRAEEKKYQKSITFILPAKWASAMNRATKRMEMSASDIARDATVEWLEMLRY